MTEPNGLPEPRTLFRSPPRAARDTPMSSTAQDVVTEAVAAQPTVDLCSKHAVRRALSRVLDDVWRAGTRGLRSGGLANVQAVLRIVGEAARAGAYTQEQARLPATVPALWALIGLILILLVHLHPEVDPLLLTAGLWPSLPCVVAALRRPLLRGQRHQP